MKFIRILLGFLIGVNASCFALQVTLEQAEEIAKKVWYHESAHQVERTDFLTFWNEVEPFPSLGIGHFIWPPKSYTGAFSSGRFHKVIHFLQEQGVQVPKWLAEARYCPWETREEFYEAFHSEKMEELRTLLQETKAYQALYMTQRLQDFSQKLEKGSIAEKHFYQVAETASGLYVLIDYLNFKHDGFSLQERYKGQGWGLMQVLENMNSELAEEDPIKSFQITAKFLLVRRVYNAYNPIAEEKWIPNWFERIDSYQEGL